MVLFTWKFEATFLKPAAAGLLLTVAWLAQCSPREGLFCPCCTERQESSRMDLIRLNCCHFGELIAAFFCPLCRWWQGPFAEPGTLSLLQVPSLAGKDARVALLATSLGSLRVWGISAGQQCSIFKAPLVQVASNLHRAEVLWLQSPIELSLNTLIFAQGRARH